VWYHFCGEGTGIFWYIIHTALRWRKKRMMKTLANGIYSFDIVGKMIICGIILLFLLASVLPAWARQQPDGMPRI
jgi:hypothetical protein